MLPNCGVEEVHIISAVVDREAQFQGDDSAKLEILGIRKTMQQSRLNKVSDHEDDVLLSAGKDNAGCPQCCKRYVSRFPG
jgi:hypothetical protein